MWLVTKEVPREMNLEAKARFHTWSLRNLADNFNTALTDLLIDLLTDLLTDLLIDKNKK